MAITQRQGIAIAVIVLAGLLGGTAVLLTERHPGGEAAGHEAHADEHRSERPDVLAGASAHDQREVRIDDAQLKAAGIAVQAAGPATLQHGTPFLGEIRFDDDRTAHIVPRLAGVAQAVPASLGQVVQAGQVLAVIASTALSEQRSELLGARKRQAAARVAHEREKTLWEQKVSALHDLQQAQAALQEADIAVENAQAKLAAVGAPATADGPLNRLALRAPFAGTVVEKHLAAGEAVKEDASVFTVSDLRSVWAEFAVAPKDLATLRVGQKVVVSSTAFERTAEGRIAYIGALLGEQTRSARARVVLANPDGAWRPGLFVTVAALGAAQQVPVAVAADALQEIDGQPTLFVVAPGGFVARPVRTGRRDGRWVEIVAGLQPGDRHAAGNTFILKSELGKAGAEHAH
ncbi:MULTISPECIES: efflux RND transporter periplasmic adaptor subunit [unclassified Rhizobacter]|uniref:efflux RND transporter periplasmic adaptor subunit n=1 Tax=unclassified Rhizobacter TaxID=2640088 RepID=UPI0006FF21B2|nr:MULTISPECIES: efflux RND transporter periplasmic adaptor subunit [unclassified Rhizobacter]KQU81551.1 cytochrome C peroxidase [Rhizobacter sp. Root29]KQW12118.1 cytochrome C peroxidase [Rhizobacter sp. Root1238]KRB02933.1 cytochrome C peroxidase [Rhizobacter sp. Root16D2]